MGVPVMIRHHGIACFSIWKCPEIQNIFRQIFRIYQIKLNTNLITGPHQEIPVLIACRYSLICQIICGGNLLYGKFRRGVLSQWRSVESDLDINLNSFTPDGCMNLSKLFTNPSFSYFIYKNEQVKTFQAPGSIK